MNYRPEIDGLRALAVVSVVLFHADAPWFEGGFVGVDIFFVISGYLISTIMIRDLTTGNFKIIDFYERRARRIIPVLFFVVFSCIPFSWILLLPNELKDFSQSIVAVVLFASNILFWSESGYFEVASDFKPLLHTWSLGVEEQFYLIFPLFFMFIYHFFGTWIVRIIVILAVSSFILSEFGTTKFATANFYFIFTRAWELFAGVLCAIYISRYGQKGSEWGVLCGLSLLLFSIFTYSSGIPYPGKYTLLPILGTALIILYSTKDLISSRILANKVAVGCGLLSYSIYLWHQPIFTFAKIRSNGALGPEAIVLVIITLLLSFLSYKFIEVPFRNKRTINRKKFVSGLVLSSFILGFLGFYGNLNNGFETRFPDEIHSKPSARKEAYKSICNYDRDYCVVGNLNSKSKILIYGDSHADRLFEPLVKSYGKKYKMYLSWERSCFLGDKKWQPNIGHDPVACDEKRNVIDLLLKEKFEVIIQAQFWINEDYTLNTLDDYRAVLAEQILSVSKTDAELILVGNTPYNPTICFQKRYLGIECDPFKEEKLFEDASSSLYLPSRDRIKFVHPYVLHKNYTNGQSLNGNLIYMDKHHLSSYGAQLLANEISSVSDVLD